MNYHIITIFPEIFDSFLSTSLIARAIENDKIFVDLINPRDFCTDKHKQIDDEPYGGGAGMLIKAEPIIDSIKDVIDRNKKLETRNKRIKLVLLNPSETVYDQKMAHQLVDEWTDVILICGRYEGIDERVRMWCEREFGSGVDDSQTPQPLTASEPTPLNRGAPVAGDLVGNIEVDFQVISLGQYVTLGGEVPAMSIIESTARLVPGVIQDDASRQNESYRPDQDMKNIEHPHYTRPQMVEGFDVPEILLSGHHEEIRKWRENHN